jgi:hypothetical protein
MRLFGLWLPMNTEASVDHSISRADSVFHGSPLSTTLLICIALLHPSTESAHAQEPDGSSFKQTFETATSKTRAECNALWSDSVFDPLRDKIPLIDDKPTHQMLTNSERLRPEDKHLADLAIKTNERCRAAYAPAYALLPVQLRAMIAGAESTN